MKYISTILAFIFAFIISFGISENIIFLYGLILFGFISLRLIVIENNE